MTKDLADDDMKWLRRILREATPVGHCGESSSEAMHRGRVEDRADRILSALRGEQEPDETAWLIEETWSGQVHYIHRDFRCDLLAAEWRRNGFRQSSGQPPEYKTPFLTKDIEKAKRFAAQSDAEMWLAFQPAFMSEGDQYQAREHMWPSPSPERTDG